MYLNDMNQKRDFFDKTKPFYDERMKSYQENKEKALSPVYTMFLKDRQYPLLMVNAYDDDLFGKDADVQKWLKDALGLPDGRVLQPSFVCIKATSLPAEKAGIQKWIKEVLRPQLMAAGCSVIRWNWHPEYIPRDKKPRSPRACLKTK